MHWTPLIIIFAFGDALPYTKRHARVEKKLSARKNLNAVLNLAREYYGDNNFKKRDVRPTKLVDFEGIARHCNVNIMVYEPKKDRGKDAGSIWQLVYGKA